MLKPELKQSCFWEYVFSRVKTVNDSPLSPTANPTTGSYQQTFSLWHLMIYNFAFVPLAFITGKGTFKALTNKGVVTLSLLGNVC